MAPKITLYTFAPSHNAVRTEIALNEKGLAFEKVSVDLLKGEHRAKWFTDITPRGQVPTLVYDAGGDPIVVYESVATIRFLDDVHPAPPLMPPATQPRRRAQALMRLEEFQAKLDPCNVFGSVVFGKQSREQVLRLDVGVVLADGRTLCVGQCGLQLGGQLVEAHRLDLSGFL